jgi:hypothetical protein
LKNKNQLDLLHFWHISWRWALFSLPFWPVRPYRVLAASRAARSYRAVSRDAALIVASKNPLSKDYSWLRASLDHPDWSSSLKELVI